MALSWKRVYFDIPSDLGDKFAARAKSLGVPQKVLFATLIERECASDAGNKNGKRKKRKEQNG